jgi:hypothetical protein
MAYSDEYDNGYYDANKYYRPSSGLTITKSIFDGLGLGFLNPIGDELDKQINPGKLPTFQHGMFMNNIHGQEQYGPHQPSSGLNPIQINDNNNDSTNPFFDYLALKNMGKKNASEEQAGVGAKPLGRESSYDGDTAGRALKENIDNVRFDQNPNGSISEFGNNDSGDYDLKGLFNHEPDINSDTEPYNSHLSTQPLDHEASSLKSSPSNNPSFNDSFNLNDTNLSSEVDKAGWNQDMFDRENQIFDDQGRLNNSLNSNPYGRSGGMNDPESGALGDYNPLLSESSSSSSLSDSAQVHPEQINLQFPSDVEGGLGDATNIARGAGQAIKGAEEAAQLAKDAELGGEILEGILTGARIAAVKKGGYIHPRHHFDEGGYASSGLGSLPLQSSNMPPPPPPPAPLPVTVGGTFSGQTINNNDGGNSFSGRSPFNDSLTNERLLGGLGSLQPMYNQAGGTGNNMTPMYNSPQIQAGNSRQYARGGSVANNFGNSKGWV